MASSTASFVRPTASGSGKLDLVMRQHHRAGETLFVDYAGQTVPVVNPRTGEVHEAAIFIAVFGRLQLYLCGSDLEPESARLDRLPCPRLRRLWRGPPNPGP